MHGLRFIAFTLFASVVACSSPIAPSSPIKPQTSYVSLNGNDKNTGTIASPWQTLRHALGEIRTGDTLYIRGGTYDGTILETGIGATGTSWTSAVTISAYPGEDVILQPTGGPGNVVRFQDASIHHVILQNLILDGIHAGAGNGASVIYCGQASHDLHFNNVEVRNGDGNGALCGGTNIEFRDMRVHGNGGPNTYQNSNGMYMTGNYISIVGGEFYDNECYGIRFWDSGHPATTANHNTVTGARIYGNGLAIGHGGTSTCDSGGGGITIGDSDNTASHNMISGNYWGSDDAFARGNGNFYLNNTFTGNRYGVNLTGNNSVFRNNATYANGDSNLVNLGSGNVVSDNVIDSNR